MAERLTAAQMAATHAAAFTLSRPWTEAEFAALLDSPLILAAGDSRCFALLRVVADEAELLTIATRPEHQRRGLARRCIAGWESDLRGRRVAEVFLEVAADNTPAQALYLACGFANCGLRRRLLSASGGQSCRRGADAQSFTLGYLAAQAAISHHLVKKQLTLRLPCRLNCRTLLA